MDVRKLVICVVFCIILLECFDEVNAQGLKRKFLGKGKFGQRQNMAVGGGQWVNSETKFNKMFPCTRKVIRLKAIPQDAKPISMVRPSLEEEESGLSTMSKFIIVIFAFFVAFLTTGFVLRFFFWKTFKQRYFNKNTKNKQPEDGAKEQKDEKVPVYDFKRPYEKQQQEEEHIYDVVNDVGMSTILTISYAVPPSAASSYMTRSTHSNTSVGQSATTDGCGTISTMVYSLSNQSQVPSHLTRSSHSTSIGQSATTDDRGTTYTRVNPMSNTSQAPIHLNRSDHNNTSVGQLSTVDGSGTIGTRVNSMSSRSQVPREFNDVYMPYY